MKTTVNTLVGTALALLLALQSPAYGHGAASESAERVDALIGDVRRATAPFKEIQAALDAGYSQFLGCVAQPGQGAMGIHFLHATYPGDALLDPLRPEALVYEPRKNGKLELVAVEYIVFQDVWDALHAQPPVMFGHPFHLVRSPNRYGVPAFYELHLWIWEHNPSGIFNDWNPRVQCP